MSATETAERIVDEALADAIIIRRPGHEWMQEELSRRAGPRVLGVMVQAEARYLTRVMWMRVLYGVQTADRLRELMQVGSVVE